MWLVRDSHDTLPISTWLLSSPAPKTVFAPNVCALAFPEREEESLWSGMEFRCGDSQASQPEPRKLPGAWLHHRKVSDSG